MELSVRVEAQDGRTVCMTAAQAQAIESLNNTRRGGCSSVKGYRPSTDWITPPVQDIQMLTNISVTKLYERRAKALSAIEYSDVAEAAAKDPKLKELSTAEALNVFAERKAMQLSQVARKLLDVPKNAHQEAHDRCYARIGNVKVHLDTVKFDGRMEPILETDGSVSMKNIMIPYLELNKVVREPGVHKAAPNSKAPVLMGKLIEKCLNQRSVTLKTLSLKGDNFESFHASHQELLPEDVAKFGDLLEE
jgi:hypothetical protein